MSEQRREHARRLLLEARTQACLFLLCVALLWKVTLTHQYTWMNFSDMVNQVLPWFQLQHREWLHGHIPLWDPFHWAGQSLVGQYQPGVLYPLNWLLFLAPDKGGRIRFGALNWYLCLIHYLAALFAFLLARDLGRSRAASVISGVAFSFLGYMAATSWPQMLNGATWAPLVLLFMLRVLRGSALLRNSAFGGAVLGFSQLSGHPQAPTFAGLMALGLWVCRLSGHRGRSNWLAFLTFGVTAFAFSAPQVLPAAEYWKRALRWVGSANPLSFADKVPYVVHGTFSMNPVSVVGLAISRLPGYANPFLGFAVLGLAFLAVCTLWDLAEVRVLTSIAVAALVYAMGSYALLEGVAYAVLPGVDKARSPAVAIFVAQLAAATLAGFGLDVIRLGATAKGQELRRIGATMSVCAAALVGLVLVSFAVREDKTAYLFNFATAGLVAGFAGATMLAASFEKIRPGTAALLMSGLVLLDAGTVTGAFYPHREQGWGYLNQLNAYDDIARYLKGRTDVERVRVDRDAIAFDFGDWYGIEQLEGYCGVTKDIFAVAGDAHAQALLGVTDWVGRQPTNADQHALFTGASGLTVYSNPDAFPRAWVVHRIARLPRAADSQSVFGRPIDDLRSTAYVERDVPGVESCGGDAVSVASRSPESVVLDARLGCKGMLILGDSYFPGWRARVDGAAAELYRVDTVVDGVILGAGRHRVEISYQPSSVRVGIILFCFGLAFVAAVVRWG